MDDNRGEALPPELQQLEATLACRISGSKSSGARSRILARVRQELAVKQTVPSANSWRVVLAAAAALILCINLSMSAVNDTGVNFARPISAVNAEQVAKIRVLVPELSENEAYREALLISVRTQLFAAPDPGDNADLDTRIKEHHGLHTSVD